MKFVFILCSLISYSAFASASDSIRSELRAEGLFVIHEVEEEETVFSIARRYGSSVQSIAKFNELSGNRIVIGQILSVLVEKEEADEKAVAVDVKDLHLVSEGETLYSISRRYDLSLAELRELNELEDNNISPGQYLRVSEDSPEPENGTEEVKPDTLLIPVEVDESAPDGYEFYYVQTGETLHSIARKRKTRTDSLREWNDMTSDYLRIGQKLIVKMMTDNDTIDSAIKLDEDGFERVFEEGIAAVISEISTTKFLALHRSLPIGKELEVRNLMNNLVVHVKIVGRLPDTGLNKGLLVRLSKPAYERLGILDSKSRVEVSYFKE